MVIARLRSDQIPEIAAIEQQNFGEPWSENAIRAEQDHAYSVTFVASDESKVLGYINAHCVLENTHINTFCVIEPYRKQGIGRRLLLALSEYAISHGAQEITLEVRKSNVSALSLYFKEEFFKVGERKNFYRHPTEDAWILKKLIRKDHYDESTRVGR